jgi:hypothetical protein
MERDANSKWENLPFPVDVLHVAIVSLYVRKDITIEDFEDVAYMSDESTETITEEEEEEEESEDGDCDSGKWRKLF